VLIFLSEYADMGSWDLRVSPHLNFTEQLQFASLRDSEIASSHSISI
jgi:hypothetical protein